MPKCIIEMIIPLITAIILTLVGFNIRRNKKDTYYLKLSQFNPGIAVLFSLATLIPAWPKEGKYIFLLFLGFIFFLTIDSLVICIKIKHGVLIIKKSILTHSLYVDIKNIVSIQPVFNFATENLCYKIVMFDNNYFLIESGIEDIDTFFRRLKKTNNEIVFSEQKHTRSAIHIIDLIIKIIIPISFYTVGGKYLLNHILFNK